MLVGGGELACWLVRGAALPFTLEVSLSPGTPAWQATHAVTCVNGSSVSVPLLSLLTPRLGGRRGRVSRAGPCIGLRGDGGRS